MDFKHSHIPILLIFAAFTSVNAQDISLIPQIGIDASRARENNMVPDYSPDREHFLLRPSIGVDAEIPLSEDADFRIGLHYSERGYKQTNYPDASSWSFYTRHNLEYLFSDADPSFYEEAESLPDDYEPGGEVEIRRIYHYIQFPVSIAYSVYNSGNSQFSLTAGGYIAYAVGGRSQSQYDMTVLSETSNHTYDAPLNLSGYNRLDFGLTGGLLYEYQRINFIASYNYGLYNTQGGIFESGTFSNSMRHLFISLKAGYRFTL